MKEIIEAVLMLCADEDILAYAKLPKTDEGDQTALFYSQMVSDLIDQE